MLATVIIPAFNCAPWLARATQSAFELGPEHIEVIIVDDGSTDDTPAVCRELKDQYPGLRVIHRVNGGPSAARNSGIQVSNGTFIIFLDGDDELMPFDLAQLLDFTGDVLRIGIEEIPLSGGSPIWWQESSDTTGGKEYLSNRIAEGNLYSANCAYVYRRAFLLKNGLRFVEGLLHEDMLFIVEALLKASAVAATSSLLYRYIRRPGSITLQRADAATRARIASLARIVNSMLDLANRNPDVDVWKRAESVTDHAWSYWDQGRTRWLAWRVLHMEWALMYRYRLWGVFRTRRSNLWRLRRAVERLLAA